MKTQLIETSRNIVHRVRSRPIFSGIIAVAALALVVIVYLMVRPAKVAASYYEVKSGDFLISVVEGGTVEAVNEVIIRNEVEGTARIIYIVPEGSYVKKGDKLVELDSSAVQDAVNQQQINVEKAQFALVQAEQQFEIQKSTVDSEVDAAKLKMEFALSDLDKFSKGEARQMRRNAEIEITNVLETLKVAEDRLIWSKKLYTNGFETKANLDKDQLAVNQGNLKWQQSTQALWMVESFDLPKKKRELEAALEEAKENLERVKLQGDRKLEQFKADASTQASTLDLNKKKLERDMKQLQATKIFAPQDGMVVYASGGSGGGRGFSNESMVEEGAVIRNRQELIKLPDISEMKLTVKIHESHINNVRLGQQAFVVLDSMPDKRFEGFVNRVAPLPDSSSRWSNPNLKVYATEILITDKLPNVKPGVSARAEVVITNLQNVLTVPIQAVTTRRGQQVVFLANAPQTPVPVAVGLYNNKFIEVSNGLQAGDRVMLSPPFDTNEKDLGGAIISGDDKLPDGDTNKIAKALERNRTGNQRAGTNAVPVGSENRPGRGPRGAEGVEDSEGGPGRSSSFSGTNQPGGGSGERRPRGGVGNEAGGTPRFNREEMLKQFDTNGDGELDETERAAMREKFGSGRGGPAGGTNSPGERRPREAGNAGARGTTQSPEELLKKFDTNGDGQLDDAERAAMREQSGGRSRPASGGTTRPQTRPE